jgi:hypothetical protein
MKIIRILCLTIFVITTLLVQPVMNQESVRAENLNLPSLAEFAAVVSESDASGPAGLYADGVFAYPIVQQPQGNAAFVSNQSGVLTSFSMASQYETTGLLAHNTMAGADFEYIHVGQTLTLVDADGKMESYQVITIERYQALSPNSPYSEFIDQSKPGARRLSATELFNHIYATGHRLVLQTCIAAEGMASWGRLFIIAVPLSQSALPLSLYEPMPSYFASYGMAPK